MKRTSADAFQLQTLGGLRLFRGDVELLPRRRKELAVLAYIAYRNRPVPRAELLNLFWGESDEVRARNSMRQALLQLRRTLGDAIDVTPDTVRVDVARVNLDAAQFINAPRDVSDDLLALWGGEFLPNADEIGTDDFELWARVERQKLGRTAYDLFERRVAQEEAQGNAKAMRAVALHWAESFPLDVHAHTRLIDALEMAGDYARALGQYNAFSTRYQEDVADVLPAEWKALEGHLRQAASDTKSGILRALPSRSRWTRSKTFWVGVAVVTVAVWTTVLVKWLQPAEITLAVGEIQLNNVPDSIQSWRLLLATNLARVSGLNVLSEERVQEVLEHLADAKAKDATLEGAARRAGATDVIEGVISRTSNGKLRLDLRRVDTKTRRTRSAFMFESNDAFELIDAAIDRLALDLGRRAPSERVEGATTSLVAYKFYEAGLRAYYQGEDATAARLFERALVEDSTFAMAALYASYFVGGPARQALLKRAVRNSAGSPERERLLIRTAWLFDSSLPVIATAESLVVRFPREPDGHLMLSKALFEQGRYLDAVPSAQRAFELDSLGLNGSAARCRACDALGIMTSAFRFVDSLPAAERLARLWVKRQPNSSDAWTTLSNILESSDRHDEALAARRKGGELNPHTAADVARFTGIWFRQGDFESIDALWKQQLATGSRGQRLRALDGLTLSYRAQGRYREALAAARELRRISTPEYVDTLNKSTVVHAYHEALTLFDMKNFRRSAAVWDSMAHLRRREDSAQLAHIQVGKFAALAASLVMFDTSRLKGLEDTVRALGAQSARPSDQQYFHYVRGLRLKAGRRYAEAALEFQRAVISPHEGPMRENLELANALLLSGHATRAVVVLRAALRGPIGAQGAEVRRTEYYEILARAYDAAGQRDSAAIAYQRILSAWKKADPELDSAKQAVAKRLSQLREP